MLGEPEHRGQMLLLALATVSFEGALDGLFEAHDRGPGVDLRGISGESSAIVAVTGAVGVICAK